MPDPNPSNFARLYESFDSPILGLDCGKKCAPYNEYGVPFCCDTSHAIPTSYLVEWDYLQSNTDLWHIWVGADSTETQDLKNLTPIGQKLIECKGHRHCQRNFRSITCRAFPFFPYITKTGEFIGLTYYWEYQDRCWVINHLEVVTPSYLQEFVRAYEWIFENISGELGNFRYHSILMRRVFGKKKLSIPLLHRNGGAFLVKPKDGTLENIDLNDLPKYGPYKVASLMPFPDET